MFGSTLGNTKISHRKAVGEDLARVLPDDGIPWWKKRHLLFLNYCAISMAMLSAANRYDGTLMNGLMSLPQWNEFMDHPTGAWLGFINAIQSLSQATALPILAYVANRFGRKLGLYVGYFFVLLGALLQAFTPNIAGFATGRFFLGQTSAWWGGMAPLLITELAYPTHQGFLTALYNCGWYVGSSIAAWSIYGTRNYGSDWAWRIPSLLQLAIPAVVLPAVLLVPESPRYLVSKGKLEEARRTLVRLHGGGDEASLLVEFEVSEIHHAIESDSYAAKSTTWLGLFESKGNRHRSFISMTLGAFAQWNGVGVVSYCLSAVLNTVGIRSITEQTLINGCLQIWNLILAVGAAGSVDRLGRRPLFVASSVGIFETAGNTAAGIAVVPLLFIYYGFYDIAFTPLLFAYPAEIWPYRLQSRGMALTQFSSTLAAFFNIFVNPIALDAIGWKYYIVFAVILAVIVVTTYLFYPETKGHTLEEMAVIFDGEDALAHIHGYENASEKKSVHHEETVDKV
ncbi:sugar transporter [Penicillium cataractarum]|uniref:Sugar transporter n=1 Tax=Penicillium cataractarum TaxID=2100454 RepID=A0A9W9S5B1_9EURO|nr:sugar transporter [Penicillium cataractarum]KAJ5371234.1 sugar transporter [Penicillium cataractarum]